MAHEKYDRDLKTKGSGCLGGTMLIVIIILLLGILSIMGYSYYNGMVTREEAVNAKWADVENLYQRRADLIGNMVATVKGYAAHENSTLVAVTEARSKASSVQIKADDLNENTLEQFEQAQGELQSAFSRLMVVVEQYPDLKANQNFLQLQAQLEQTENMIASERKQFNDVARDYNVAIRKFPRNLFAGMFGFEPKAYFKAKEGADEVPKVEF